jgi:parvulin-like peptidyl-prolyl isomerase
VETIEKNELQTPPTSSLFKMTPAADQEVLAYLRHSCKLAEIAILAEQDALIVRLCEHLEITVTEQELQAAGDTFRLQHKLLNASEAIAWLAQQRISVEDWAEGIKTKLLRQKLNEHLFGAAIDNHYMSHRQEYQRVALSQILVDDLTDALNISQALQAESASFCALALEYSKGPLVQERGGFTGVHFLSKLLPEITQAVSKAKAGESVGPIQTQFGYHIVKVEKKFPTQLDQITRTEILNSLFQTWLKEQR